MFVTWWPLKLPTAKLKLKGIVVLLFHHKLAFMHKVERWLAQVLERLEKGSLRVGSWRRGN
jgi:hypothetical protein